MAYEDVADRVRQARELFFATGRLAPGLVTASVVTSWRRCRTKGLTREDAADEAPLPEPLLRERLTRNRLWLADAEPVLERLATQLAGSSSVLALVDAQGVLLKTQGDAASLAAAGPWRLVPGWSWSEAARGTNAIGTALLEGRPLAIHGAEHYHEALLGISGAAAPIFRPDGEIAGAFAITGNWRGPQPYLLALAQMAALMVENRMLAAWPSTPAPRGNVGPGTLADLVGSDVAIEAAARRAQRIVGKDIPLLIEGDTGTGKEVFARAFHLSGPRAGQPFVAVNCAAIPEGLIESELFGYAESAFTGARRKGSPGKIVQAHGGTLFLDEVGDMPLSLQARLLRVLQEREVTPLGACQVLAVDIALVCATNRKLLQAVEQGRFREDLYYRINGLRVSLPPLKERSDLGQLVAALLAGEGAPARTVVAPRVLECFRRHAWPGNVRQLKSVLRIALAHMEGEQVLDLIHLPEDYLDPLGPPPRRNSLPAADLPVQPALADDSLAEIECTLMRHVLDECHGNVSAASRRLGISRNTLYRKLGLWGRES
jgi:transcriptional regulator of acetoin/glycerol metabolism